MREDLAREFPEAVRALNWTRTRLPARTAMFRHEPVLWGTVSAIGAGFLVSAVTQFLVGLGFDLVRLFDVRTTTLTLGWLPGLLGTAATIAVALRVGGRFSFALYLAYIALDLATRIPGTIAFCERSGFGNLLAYQQCDPLGFLAAQWTLWTGIGAGLLLSRAIVARDEGANRTLRVAGAYAVAWSVVLDAWAMTTAQQGDPAGALNASLTISMLAVAAGVAAGVVAGSSARRIRTAAIVAVAIVLPWTTVLPLRVSQLGTMPAEVVPGVLIGTFSTPVAALALVLTAVLADRRRFIPREAA